MVCVIGEALIDLVSTSEAAVSEDRSDAGARTGAIDGVVSEDRSDAGARTGAIDGVAAGDRGYLAHPGGSPYNVAIGLARLGNQATLLARLSGDAFGRQLRSHAEANGVDLSLAV